MFAGVFCLLPKHRLPDSGRRCSVRQQHVGLELLLLQPKWSETGRPVSEQRPFLTQLTPSLGQGPSTTSWRPILRRRHIASLRSWCSTATETIRLTRYVRRWRRKEIIYLSLHCHHQNDSYIKTGSDESHFNVSLIVRDKVTRQRPQQTPSTGLRHPSFWKKVPESDARSVCPQTTPFEDKWEPKRNRAEAHLLTRLTPYRWTKPAHSSRVLFALAKWPKLATDWIVRLGMAQWVQRLTEKTLTMLLYVHRSEVAC